MATPLNGRVVAITGGARGLGFTTARELIARGARVAIGDIDEDRLKKAAAELGIETYAKLDVTDPESFRRFLDLVESEQGPLDVLINNAGIMPVGPLLDETEQTARRVIEINVLGVMTGTKLGLEKMVPRGRGHVINIASMAGVASVPGLASYNASKFAVVGFTDAVRLEFRNSGVDVSMVLPTFANTELTSGLKGARGFKNAEPQQIADAIVGLLNKPRPRVYVTRMIGLVLQAQAFIPRQIGEAVNRLLGADTVFLHCVDHERRHAYDERVAKS